MSFHKDKLELRSYWKKIKVGFIKEWDTIPFKYQVLLMKYYPQVEAYLGNINKTKK